MLYQVIVIDEARRVKYTVVSLSRVVPRFEFPAFIVSSAAPLPTPLPPTHA